MSAQRKDTNPERYDPNRQAANDAVSHANWSEKKWVWIPDQVEGYLGAYIASEDGERVVVKLASNDYVRITFSDRAIRIIKCLQFPL